MIRVFISYAHSDESLHQELGKHLASLKHQGLVEIWHDRLIDAGDDWAQAIDANITTADVILLLISSDFIASRYCFELEAAEAMRRHAAGEAVVIPVILRPCDWHSLPFGKLQAATKDGRPVVKFQTLDDGFLEVVQAIKKAAIRTTGPQGSAPTTSATSHAASPPRREIVHELPPRSSNLHVARTFDDRDRDQFCVDAIEYMATFFENSLTALEDRNPQIKTQFRHRDADSFEATVYENGKQASRCGIWMAKNRFGGDIAYSNSGLSNGNSYNESLSVADDGHVLGLKPLGMAAISSARERLLTLEGAAEYFWAMLIHGLQQH